MKKLLSFTTGKMLAGGIAILFELVSFNAIAQPPCTIHPTKPDNTWGANNSKVWGSATIDYTPNCAACTPGSGSAQLSATIEVDSFIIGDGVNTPKKINLPTTGAGYDVVIGNDGVSTGNYIMAIAGNTTGPEELYIYNITNPGTSSFAVSLNSVHTLSGARIKPLPQIDIIAEYGNNFPTSSGLPFCNQFVMTWIDANGLEAYHATLNNPTSGTVTNIVSSSILASPDVAAIQRNVSGNIDNMALFVYIDSATTPRSLMYVEWDITANTISAPVTIDTFSGDINGLKIDAIDDYTINDPTITNPLAYYCIVASTNDSNILMYNNLVSGATNLTGSSCLANHTSKFPQVSAGPDSHYTITYGAITTVPPAVIAQTVDWSTGAAGSSFYQVNTGGASNDNVPFIVTSSSCNTEDASQQTFVFFEGSTNKIFYKQTDYPYVFKPASVATTAGEQSWKVYPVPATDYLQVTPPSAFQNTNLQYTLLDMTGRVMQTGTISAGNSTIGIGNLPPGVCNISVFQDGVKLYNQLVVIE